MQNTFRWTIGCRRYVPLAVGLACLFATLLVTVPAAQSATVWTKTTTAGGPWYWYDDYTAPDGTVESPFNTVTPPGGAGNANSNWNDGHRITDYTIATGYDFAGQGVVFDPDTDPFKTGQPSVGSVGLGSGASPTPYGTGAGQVTLSDPFIAITRLYLTNTQDTAMQPNNKLTLKSGTLAVREQIRVVRSNANTTTATGIIVQEKGTNLIVDAALGQYMSLGDGDQMPTGITTPTTVHGIYDYRGGTLEVGVATTNTTATGIRLGSASTGNGPNNKNYIHRGTLIVNPEDVDAGAGHIRAQNFQSGVGNTGDGSSSNIIYTLATTEFHYQNAGSGWDGTRAVQILQDLSIRNTGDPSPPGGYPGTANPDYGDLTIGSSRLDVVLDEAPTVSGSQGGYQIPINLALFDVDHGDGTNTNDIITASGSQGPDQFYSSSSLFSLPADHLTDADAIAEDDGVDLVAGLLEGGDIVSATIGGETYRWKIYYSGNITWSSADNSTIADPNTQITGPNTGKDVVLIGYNSTIAAVASTTGDFDDDGDQDAADIDILWHIIRGTGTDPNPGGGVGVLSDTADLNGDTFANEDDVDLMLASKLTAGTNRAYGDANLSGGTPELTDYNLWRTGTGGWANGDFDGSGGVPELNDYNLWRTGPTQFPGTVGSHGGGGGAPLVAEPATLVLMGLGLPVLVLVARRRKAAM